MKSKCIPGLRHDGNTASSKGASNYFRKFHYRSSWFQCCLWKLYDNWFPIIAIQLQIIVSTSIMAGHLYKQSLNTFDGRRIRYSCCPNREPQLLPLLAANKSPWNFYVRAGKMLGINCSWWYNYFVLFV